MPGGHCLRCGRIITSAGCFFCGPAGRSYVRVGNTYVACFTQEDEAAARKRARQTTKCSCPDVGGIKVHQPGCLKR